MPSKYQQTLAQAAATLNKGKEVFVAGASFTSCVKMVSDMRKGHGLIPGVRIIEQFHKENDFHATPNANGNLRVEYEKKYSTGYLLRPIKTVKKSKS